jgi:hypothetical protein
MSKFESVQKIQDEIFKKMSAEKKVELVLEFSLFCLKLQKENQHGARKSFSKSSSNIRGS